jgi:acyl carrier protein
VIAEIWRDLLGVEHVGVDDDFFELHGDSLLGTQLISRIGREFRVNVPFRSLFEGPTIARLAQVVETLRASEQELRAIPDVPLGHEEEEGEL